MIRLPTNTRRDGLTAETARLAARNLVLAHELRAILRTCSEARIRCVPLRGLALAERLYGNLLSRPMGDIDLLVRKSDLGQVQVTLQHLGYQLCDRRPGFSREFSYTFEFFKVQPVPCVVEPHWTIAYPPFVERLDMEAVWQRCVPGRLLGVETLCLSREDLVLNLCLHLVHHGSAAPLLWVDELDQLLRKEQAALDWNQLRSIAAQAGVEQPLAHALTRSHGLFQTPLPEHLIERLAVRRSGSRSVARRLIEESNGEGKESLAVFFSLKGLPAKWRYARQLVFPSPEFMKLHYGLSHGWPLCIWYPRRALQLALGALHGLVPLVIGSLRRRLS